MVNVRRSVVEALANDNWERADVLEHWTTKDVSRSAIVHKFQNVFVLATSSAAPLVYPRHRWTGAEKTMLWVLLLHSCHGLLAKAYSEWCKSRGGTGDGEVEDGALGVVDSHIVAHDPAAANAVPDVTRMHQQEASRWRRSAQEWLHNPDTLGNMLIFRQVHEGHRRMLHELLSTSGKSWQRRQAWRELDAQRRGCQGLTARDFKVTLAQSGRPTLGNSTAKPECLNPIFQIKCPCPCVV